jgi:hypothetical protein
MANGDGFLTPQEIYQNNLNAGFTPDGARTMTAINMAESRGNPSVINWNDPGGSFGLYQINARAHGLDMARASLDPTQGAKIAFQLSKGGTNFSPWTTYGSGLYKQYLDTPDNLMAGENQLGAGPYTLTAGSALPYPSHDTFNVPGVQGARPQGTGLFDPSKGPQPAGVPGPSDPNTADTSAFAASNDAMLEQMKMGRGWQMLAMAAALGQGFKFAPVSSGYNPARAVPQGPAFVAKPPPNLVGEVPTYRVASIGKFRPYTGVAGAASS